ncbi:stage V sporulation protein AB [Caldifermentibacillus hisashii]|jgi:stage V sporulation protein AB|uniref:stage V sporulation protein AB n=1 Tax=Caldifermentibacillus hisashii TaxID=996558 RepID=UPI002DFC2C58|nr:stage V sporulation protein AB [Caldifermentibacillus hisashii]MED4853690.1 stage V sporulation protein AB [Caldifermentibacillus hisashii]
MAIKIIFVIGVGLACGFAVGAGFVAFITVLGIIPRLMQLTKSMKMILFYEWAVTLGVLVGTVFGLQKIYLELPKFFVMIIGLFHGVFVGMLAAALYEAINVLPLIFKRIHLDDRLLYLLAALVLGKILGSLFHWLYFVNL